MRNRFNANISDAPRIIRLRTGASQFPRVLTGSERNRLRALLTERLSTLKATTGTVARVGLALNGSVWITLTAGSLPARTCMDMSAYAAGALAMMMATQKGAIS